MNISKTRNPSTLIKQMKKANNKFYFSLNAND